MEKKKYRRTNILVRATVVLLIAFIIITTIDMQVKLKALRSHREALENEVVAVRDDIDELQVRIDEAKEMSDEYIARVAIEKLGYRYKGEIVFYNDIAD